MKISYDCCDFKGTYSHLNSANSSLTVDWEDLLWAIMTVGKRHRRALYSNGFYSHAEILNRIYLLLANLTESRGYIYTSDIYSDSDPTEKTFTSFMLGMAMSKLFSEKLIQTPWLAHVHCLKSVLGIPVGASGKVTKSRPDLIGRNIRGEFVIVEAKGTSGKFNSSTQVKAKQQTTVIGTVNGKAPVVRVASQAYFSDELSVYFQDPEPERDGLQIEFEENEYFSAYYHLLSNLSDETTQALKRFGIEIGFTQELEGALESRDFSRFKEQANESYKDNSGFKVFSDGIKIRLNTKKWKEALTNAGTRSHNKAFKSDS
ncbi:MULTISPECIES: hypothetical protein [Vibrio harveyi group]|uniref:hypothetical protein n=1 Tax=Vibrio harveyi group TaxID=717610 RepID=UPI0004DB5360|nr:MULTISPECIES: hypothetical protein [Vibrio harveyi group]AQM66631.1 hypothetical protein Vca1114GL_00108 [Vibrio campbellii]